MNEMVTPRRLTDAAIRRAKYLIEPLAAVALFWTWLVAVAPPSMNTVGVRSDLTVTSPYAVAIAFAFALALAVTRLSPGLSIGIVVLAIAAQFVGWAARFSNTSWTAYLILAAVVLALSVHARGRIRISAIALALPMSVAISALLNVPALSLSGESGLINGRANFDAEAVAGFAIWTGVALLVGVAMWWLPAWLRSLRPAPAPQAEPSANAALAELSARERDIYLWVAEGMTNAEIAAAAHIEESTVKTHISRILAKLQLTSRTAVIAHAYRVGALVPEASEPSR